MLKPEMQITTAAGPIGAFGQLLFLTSYRRVHGNRRCRDIVEDMRRQCQNPGAQRDLVFVSPICVIRAAPLLDTWEGALASHCKICGQCPLSKKKRVDDEVGA